MDNLGMNEYEETERMEKAAREMATDIGLETDLIAEWLIEWAVDSQSISGLAFQIAATQEFGAILSTYTSKQADRRGMNITGDFTDERAILRWIQDNSRIRKPMTLYRGTSHSESNGLESWTDDREIAEFYVARNGGGEVIERTFEANQILGTWRDGIGLECAREVVVIAYSE